MKEVFICGNWKMNKTISEANSFINDLIKLEFRKNISIGVAPSFLALSSVKNSLKNSSIKLVAQNAYYKEGGAFTGEVSIAMLKEISIDYIIIGHSERRAIFNETDSLINLKIKAALENKIKVIFCIGETLKDRETNNTFKIIEAQLKEGLKDVDDLSLITIAYEPVWAIGTGKTATVKEASEVHLFIRNYIANNFHYNKLKILYGGSVNKDNLNALLNDAEIDGALVGGAALDINFYKSILDINI